MKDIVFKLCIFGDGGVGKTTMTERYVTGLFKEDTRMTIGSDFHIKTVDINGKQVLLQIWDFAGEKQFRFLLPTYVRGASGGIFMYDLTRFSSLKNLDEWLEALLKGIDQEDPLPIILVGGKKDLEFKRAVSHGMAEMKMHEHNIEYNIECSAKTGENVEEVFYTIAEIMMKKANLL